MPVTKKDKKVTEIEGYFLNRYSIKLLFEDDAFREGVLEFSQGPTPLTFRSLKDFLEFHDFVVEAKGEIPQKYLK